MRPAQRYGQRTTRLDMQLRGRPWSHVAPGVRWRGGFRSAGVPVRREAMSHG